jgi:hypothetical protein
VARMKMAVFWLVGLCSLVEVYQNSVGSCCFPHQGDDHPDDGNSKQLRNIGKLLPDCTML